MQGLFIDLLSTLSVLNEHFNDSFCYECWDLDFSYNILFRRLTWLGFHCLRRWQVFGSTKLIMNLKNLSTPCCSTVDVVSPHARCKFLY